jgi:hypothetical protein
MENAIAWPCPPSASLNLQNHRLYFSKSYSKTHSLHQSPLLRAVTLNSPFSSLAIASLNSQPPLLFPTTHFLNARTCRLDYKMGILMKFHFSLSLSPLLYRARCVWFVCLCCFDFVQCSVLAGESGLARLQTQVVFNKSAIFIICIPMEDSRECNPGFKEFSALWLNVRLQCNLYLLWLLILCRSCRKQSWKCRKMLRFKSLKIPQMAINIIYMQP